MTRSPCLPTSREPSLSARRMAAAPLSGGQPVAKAAQVHDELQIQAGAGAGVEVRGHGHGHALFDHGPGRGEGGAQIEAGGGQQAGHGARLRHGGDALRGADDEVLGGDSAHRLRELGAADGIDLVGVNLGDKAIALARLQDCLGLLGGEDAGLAEHVAEFRQLFLGHGRDELLAQEANVAFPVRLIFLGHRVGPQEGGYQVHGVGLVEAADGAKLLELVVHIEAVAALGFHGGDAQGEHLVQSFPGLLRQLLLGGGSRGVDGGQDAAAHGQDVQIGGAVELEPQLVLPPAAEDQVGVGVHEARGHQFAAGVDDLGPRFVGRVGADLRDEAVLDLHIRVLQHPDLALLRPAAGGFALRGGQHADILDDHLLHGCVLSNSRRGEDSPCPLPRFNFRPSCPGPLRLPARRRPHRAW